MSTRANVIIKDKNDTLYFYRHSDGYPEETGESLIEFIKIYEKGARLNVAQSAGWLILHGHAEYRDSSLTITKDTKAADFMDNENKYSNWKVGAYEPTTGIHGDIEYLYTIDLSKKTLTIATNNKKVLKVVKIKAEGDS